MAEPRFDLISIIAIAGGIQGILLSIACISKKYKRSSLFLSSFLFLTSIHILYITGLHTRLIYKVPHLVGIMDPLNFIYVPIFYFYVLSVIKPSFHFKWWHLFHLLPFIWYTHKIFGLYTSSAEYKIRHLDFYYQNLEYTNARSLSFLMLSYAAIYFGSVLWIYFRHLQKISESGQLLRKKGKSGLHLVLGGYFLVLLVKSSRIFFAYETTYIMMEGVFAAFLFYAVGYVALIRPNFIYSLNKGPDHPENAQKYDLDLVDQIEEFMVKNEPYLDNDLNITKLATSLGIHPQKLSTILNHHFQCNFFNFINRYRIEEAKRRLIKEDWETYSLEKIYREVGFNSKSSFHSAFKKLTNQTPLQYKNSFVG